MNKYIEIYKIKNIEKGFKEIRDIKFSNLFEPSVKKSFEPSVKNLCDINKEVNKIISEKSLSGKNTSTKTDTDPNIQMICISNSNYSSVYIVANKISNTIFVCFRGTYSLKSSLSYLKTTSIVPFIPCFENGYLLGVFKIVGEIFYTIEESIHFLSRNFLKNTSYKLITTGHSLGGGLATIFSYLWVNYDKKNTNNTNRIACITFGSPSVMNGPLMKKYTYLMSKDIILFKRYITNGDPFANLPFSSNKLSTSRKFYQPDMYDNKFSNTSITCKLVSKKSICQLTNKTKKRKPQMKYHGNYLGFNYKGAAQDLKNFKKEIKRNSNGDTVCRIIFVNVDNSQSYKVSFFNLNDVKKKVESYNTEIYKLKKLFLTDYKHQDIYMSKETFYNIFENSQDMRENFNPLIADNYVPILYSDKPKNELYCV
jgi:hypothetical protein